MSDDADALRMCVRSDKAALQYTCVCVYVCVCVCVCVCVHGHVPIVSNNLIALFRCQGSLLYGVCQIDTSPQLLRTQRTRLATCLEPVTHTHTHTHSTARLLYDTADCDCDCVAG